MGASRQAKEIYDTSAQGPSHAAPLWLCGHFTAKSFALLLSLLGEDRSLPRKRFLFWQTKSSVQPLGSIDEWSEFEKHRRLSKTLVDWAVVGGVFGTGHPSAIGSMGEPERAVTGPLDYK